MSERRVVHQAGLTLVEVLLAMAIVSILITAVVSLSQGILRYSAAADTMNERLEELNDAMGYVVIRARGAMEYTGSFAVAVASGSDGTATSFTCDAFEVSGQSCVGMVVPIVDRSSGDITGYEFLSYRIAVMDDWTSNPGIPAGWNEGDTPLMLEYRAPLSCPAPCNSPPSAPTTTGSSVSANRVSLVIANLDVAEITPVEVDDNLLTIRLQARGTGNQSDRTVPTAEPLEVRVARRP